jgi:hypothetical protein
MDKLKKTRVDALNLGGDLIEYRLSQHWDEYKLSIVAGNLTGGISVQQNPADDVYHGLFYKMRYDGGVTYTGGNVVSVFNRALTKAEAFSKLVITATYNLNTTLWEVDVQIDTANLLLDLTRGFVWIGNTSNTPTPVDAKTVARLLAGDGTDCLSMEVDSTTGQIVVTVAAGKLVFTLKNLGVVTAMLANSAVSTAKIAAQAVTIDKLSAAVQSLIGANGYLTFDVTIPNVDVLTCGAVPYEVVPNPGVGLVAVLIEASADIVNAGVVVSYSAGEVGALKTSGATKAQLIGSADILVRTVTGKVKMNGASAATVPGVADTVLKPNANIVFTTVTGVNPLLGNSDIRLQGTYKIIAE